jgi:hypothetical protein
MTFRSARVFLALVFASVLMAQSVRCECIEVPLRMAVQREDIALLFSGTVLSIIPIGETDKTAGFKVSLDVDRTWKGSVGRRVDLYKDLNAENPKFEVGHRYLTFAKQLVDHYARQLMGLGDADAPALRTVPCTGGYSVAEITSILGPGRPPKETSPGRANL